MSELINNLMVCLLHEKAHKGTTIILFKQIFCQKTLFFNLKQRKKREKETYIWQKCEKNDLKFGQVK